MSRFFFHLRDGTDHLIDPDGIELTSFDAVQAMALRSARDTLSHGLLTGVLDLRYRIDVEDADRSVVHSLPLGDAFEIVPAVAR